LIQSILVPVDGSDNSNRALEFAIEIGKRFEAEIEILHVASKPVDVFNTTPDEIEEEHFNRLVDNKQSMLKEALRYASALAPHLEVTVKLQKGNTANKILAEADEGNFDLIVMGSRGLGNIQGLLLGSISRIIINRASVPVTIVK
jgi:nucleotide-binding universal stress UspA family protein